MALTDTWLRANLNKTQEKVVVKSDRDGLGVRISAKGKMTFQFRYRFPKGSKQKRLDLGNYPNLGLKEARVKIDYLNKKIEAGVDPIIALEENFSSEDLTFKRLYLMWYEKFCMVYKTRPEVINNSMVLHVLPTMGKYQARDITTQAWYDLFESHRPFRPAIVDRLLCNSKQVYGWALQRGLLKVNPIANVSAKRDLRITKSSGQRTLSDEEIIYFFKALHYGQMAEKNRVMLTLCFIYGCRIGELRLARYCDVDYKTGIWSVPVESHKMGGKTLKPLLRPIISWTRDLFKRAEELSNSDEYFFSHRFNNTVLKPNMHLSIPRNLIHHIEKFYGFKMEPWTVHDLRRTARTNFSQEINGERIAPHVAEVMLGHKLPGEWQVYDHYDYLTEQAQAYNLWANKLKTLMNSEIPEAVITEEKVW